MVNWIENKDLFSVTEEYPVVLVGTNVYCLLSNGIQRKLRKKYPILNDANMKMSYGDIKRIGTRLNVMTDKTLFSLCYITGYPNARPDLQKDYLHYDGLINCLQTADIEFANCKVATTLMGTSRFDGNGDIERVKKIFETHVKNMELDVYLYRQISRDEENKQQWLEIQQYKKTDRATYDKLVAERKKNWKSLYL